MSISQRHLVSVSCGKENQSFINCDLLVCLPLFIYFSFFLSLSSHVIRVTDLTSKGILERQGTLQSFPIPSHWRLFPPGFSHRFENDTICRVPLHLCGFGALISGCMNACDAINPPRIFNINPYEIDLLVLIIIIALVIVIINLFLKF